MLLTTKLMFTILLAKEGTPALLMRRERVFRICLIKVLLILLGTFTQKDKNSAFSQPGGKICGVEI